MIDQEIAELDGWSQFEFDDESTKETQAEIEEKGKALATKYHQLYKQNPIGKEILAHMIRTTLMRATVLPQSTQFEAGIREGRADMVRQILQQIEIAERN